VRHVLDSAGLQNIKIMASGGLDEMEISRLVQAQAPIDSFGVGTSMGVSADAPALDIAYKLTEYAGTGRMKLASGKSNLPGRKQVYRQTLDGKPIQDTIALASEILPGRPLLQLVMEGGRFVGNHPMNLNEIRRHARAEIDSLPDGLRSLSPAEPYPVSLSPGLVDLRNRLEEEIRRRMAADARAAAA
jgi:nicotinate phosphoribosyltransferase